MTVEELQRQDDEALADYMWRRLRLEPPVDPPLADRHGAEPPEQFPIDAARNVPAFHGRLVLAVRDNLRRLAELQAVNGTLWADAVANQQVASLAYLASRLPAPELIEPLYTLACAWFLDLSDLPDDLDDGRFQVLRTLALLQRDATLAPFWETLWARGPRSVRGLTIVGWARADRDRALQHLGELIGTEGVDLPATLWALVAPSGPGVPAIAEAVKRLSVALQKKVTYALRRAGADADTLRAFRVTAEDAHALYARHASRAPRRG